MEKQIEYFIVKNKTSGEVGKEASIGSDNFTYLELEEGSPRPQGEVVNELQYEEALAVLSLPIYSSYTGGIKKYKRIDKIFCEDIILQFESETGALSLAQTLELIELLGGVLRYLEIHSPHHAKTALEAIVPTPLFVESLKNKYVSILENYLNKYPRL